MTAVDVDALDAARAAATAGEWVLAEWNDATILAQRYLDSLAAGEPEDQRPAFLHATTSNAPDAALIVAAVNALPDLLAEVRRGRALRERHDELRHRLKALVDEWDAMARNLHHIPVAEAYADVVIGLSAALTAVDQS